MKKTLLLHPEDTVATALETIEKNNLVCAVDPVGRICLQLTALEEIGEGHKIALQDIAPGQPVQKYGHVIGCASHPIIKGQRVHTHNLGSLRGRGDLQ